ncbi:aryl-sulfate sulfotransferase [uncultured Formosa sp.]|uniref:aryl-sulfate sulfotransferase n=1 Tax=uncultured Formosa sp. TaxID=255435 RepID=UPI00261CC8A6|nr:aryl-sulfate sulfotransferase [uncultured Formosa sp.]
MKDNALKIKIDVETSEGADAYIQYWTYTNTAQTDSVISYSLISREKNLHHFMLVDVNLNTKYNFNVVVQKKSLKRNSKTYDFSTTRKIPWVPYYRNTDSISNVKFDGYLHFHSRQIPGYLFITNGEGKLASYYKNEDNFKVSKWTNRETLLGILSNDTLHFTNGKKIIEYDKFGNTLLEIETGKDNIEHSFHHEVDLDENGNVMTLVYNERIMDLSAVGGTKTDTIKGDGILVLNHKKEVVWEWSVFDVMNPLDDKTILKSKKDWLHANSLFKDKQGDYYVSFRNISQIWKINGKTGKLIWKLGGTDGDFIMPEDAVFSGQHNIRINENNELVLLDNGNLRFKPGFKQASNRIKMLDINAGSQSRLLTISLDTIQMKAKAKDIVPFPKKYFTHSQGSAEYINDSLVVFCSTNTNRIVFTNKNGNVLGNMPLEYSTYRVQYLKALYDTSYVK